jgi:hypothetical protein
MQLSNFERTKLEYYNRKLGNKGDKEFVYFTLKETLNLYVNEMTIALNLAPTDTAAIERFRGNAVMLQHYHELLHKQQRVDDAQTVYKFTTTASASARFRSTSFIQILQDLADAADLKFVQVQINPMHFHLHPTEATNRVLTEALFKADGLSFELLSPPMAITVEAFRKHYLVQHGNP